MEDLYVVHVCLVSYEIMQNRVSGNMCLAKPSWCCVHSYLIHMMF